jgi:hypothetical protein
MKRPESIHQHDGVDVIAEARQELPPPFFPCGNPLKEGTDTAELGQAIPTGTVFRHDGHLHGTGIPIHFKDGNVSSCPASQSAR